MVHLLRGTFQFGNDMIECILDGNNLMFMDISTGMITTPEGLRISKDGVTKQFPDLRNDDEWKKKAIERLKEHMKKFDTGEKKLSYIKGELVRYGYTPLFKQRAGWRPEKF